MSFEGEWAGGEEEQRMQHLKQKPHTSMWGKREPKKRKSEKVRESQKKEDAGARIGRKGAIPCLFLMICGSGGSKSRLPKVVGAEPAGQMRDEKFASQNVKNTTCSDHF